MKQIWNVLENGQVVNTIVAKESYMAANFADYVLVGERVEDLGKIISVKAFMKRLDKKVRKILVSKSKNDVDIEDFVFLLQFETEVDLEAQDVIDLINGFVASNDITQAEADAILQTPVKQDELP